MKKIAIFIPAYNVSSTIPIVIDRIPKELKQKLKEIFVIDNASSDSTYLTVIGYKHYKNMQNLSIIRNRENKGYGGSQKVAYKYAIDRGYDIIVMLHGDAQYAPEYIPKIIEPLEKGQADMVFGSRIKGSPLKGGMPFWKYMGNRFLTIAENMVLGLSLSEYHSGFRAFNVKSLKKIPFHLCSDDYHFDTDILIQFRIAGFRIKETPIPTHYGKDSKSPPILSLISYSWNILLSLVIYLLIRKNIIKNDKFNFKVKD